MANPNTVPEMTIYTVGGTVQAGGGFYIHREADEELLKMSLKKDYSYVLSTRQVGKSSLMVRTAERLTEEGTRVALVDLTALGVNVSDDQWYQGLVALISEHLMLQTNAVEWWRAHEHFGNAQRLILFFETVVLPEGPVVVFVDEIDTTRSMEFTDDFYAALRFMWNERATKPIFNDLCFVLIGVATPHDLIQDPIRTPFNIGKRIDLKDWSYDDALPLAAGLAPDVNQAREVLGWILEWTNGHPFLTQRLCAEIAEQRRTDWTRAAVDEVVTKTFFGSDRDLDTNLQFVRDMLTWRAPNKEAVLRIYQDVREGNPVRDEYAHQDAFNPKAIVRDEDKSLHKAHLKLAGLIRSEGGKLQVRNRIYYEVFDEEWIKKEMPVNWQRRLYYTSIALLILLVFITVPISVIAVRKRNEALVSADRLAEANIQLEQTNDKLATTNNQLEQTNDTVEQTNHQLATTNNQLEQTNKELKTAKEVALLNQQRAQKSAEEAVRAQKYAEEQRLLADSQAKLAAGSALEARTALSSLYLVRGKQEIEHNNLAGSAVFLEKSYEIAGNLVHPKYNEIRELLAETSQYAKPLIDFGESREAEISPSGKYVVSLSKEGKPQLWNSQTGRPIKELPGEGYGLLYDPLRSSPNDTYAWSANNERFVLQRLGLSNVITFELFDGRTGEPLSELTEPGQPSWLFADFPTFYWPENSNERFLIVSITGITLWNGVTGKFISRIPVPTPSRATWVAAGRRFLTVSSEGQVQLWKAEDGSNVETLPFKIDFYGTTLGVLGGHSRILIPTAEKVTVWNAMTGKWVADVPAVQAFALALSPDEKVIYTQTVGRFQLWQADNGGPIAELDAIRAYRLGTRSIVTVSQTGAVHLWDANSGSKIRDLPVNSPLNVSTGSGERFMIVTDTTTTVWNARDGELIKTLPLETLSVYSIPVWFDNDSWFFVQVKSGKWELWDAKKGEFVRLLPLKYGVNDLVTSSVTGRRILTRAASVNNTGRLQLWDLKFEPISEVEMVEKARCAPYRLMDDELEELDRPKCSQ